jgi:hypothetical protein
MSQVMIPMVILWVAVCFTIVLVLRVSNLDSRIRPPDKDGWRVLQYGEDGNWKHTYKKVSNLKAEIYMSTITSDILALIVKDGSILKQVHFPITEAQEAKAWCEQQLVREFRLS